MSAKMKSRWLWFATIGLNGTAYAAVSVDPNAPIAACPAGLSGPIASKSAISLPKVGEEIEAEIGQSVISSAQGEVLISTVSLKQDLLLSGNYVSGFTVQIPAGTYNATLMKGGWEYFVNEAIFRYGNSKPRHGFSKPDTTMFYDQYTGVYKAKVYFGLINKILDFPQDSIMSKKCLSISSQGFRRELLYSGTSKGTVSFEYREFVNDLARPAFSQHLSYDLSTGNEIGYNGARILIISASNVSIRFKVLKSLD